MLELEEVRLVSRLTALIKVSSIALSLAAFGFFVGLMVVVLPPLAWIGIVALSLAFLLWVLPDLNLFSSTTVTFLFYIAFTSQIIFPVYYAFALPGLPWISLRRLTWFPMALAACLLIASSTEARTKIANAMGNAKAISIPAVGFIISQFLSIFTSINFSESLKDFTNSFLYWYLGMFISIFCLLENRSKKTIFSIICYVCIIAGILGSYEAVTRNHFMAHLWPESAIAQLFSDNPQMFENIVRNIIRGGQFRANFIYTVSLSFGEFLATCVPICLYFSLHGSSTRERLIGIAASLACLAGVYASGSRGAMSSAAIAVPLMLFLWLIRSSKRAPNSLATPIAAVSLFGLILTFGTLMLVSQRFQVAFTGGAEAAGSTAARLDQWRMAIPKIISNPLTGHGTGLGADIVGYAPFGFLTVDTYPLSLIVETGVLGLLSFFTMIIASVYLLIRDYLDEDDPISAYSGPIAAAIVSFGTYRLALSQRENHILFFIFIGYSIVLVSASRDRIMQRIRARSVAETARGR